MVLSWAGGLQSSKFGSGATRMRDEYIGAKCNAKTKSGMKMCSPISTSFHPSMHPTRDEVKA